jgi:glutaredoxin
MKAIIWSKDFCPYCIKAKYALKKSAINYEERIIGAGWTREQLLEELPNARSVPQIFIDGNYVGGYNELMKSGILDNSS